MGMNIKKFRIGVLAVLMLLVSLAGGCGKDYMKMVENHAAIKTYRDGVWSVRYLSVGSVATVPGAESISVQLSVDVNKDMTEKQIMDVMDYYEFTRNAWFGEDGTYKGERDTEYACYAVFYRGGTDEEICRIKYQNGRETEPTEEEESVFPMPGLHTDEIGENP